MFPVGVVILFVMLTIATAIIVLPLAAILHAMEHHWGVALLCAGGWVVALVLTRRCWRHSHRTEAVRQGFVV
jgi:hypothetical protein